MSQRVANVSASLDGDNVIVRYDIVEGQTGQRFTIDLYSSEDNFTESLKLVDGDVGPDVSPGPSKTITWRAKEELGAFTGDISFEVRSTITASPIRITSPASGASVKVGKNLAIQWLGGLPNSTIQIDLYKSSTSTRTIGTSANTRLYNWTVPKDLDPGDGYHIQMYDRNNPSNTQVASGTFTLAKSGPVKYIIAGSALVVGAVIYAVTRPKPEPRIVDSTLPGPPDPMNGFSSAFQTGGGLGVRIGF